MNNKNTASLEAAHSLWEQGMIFWKLDRTQRDMYEMIQNMEERIAVIMCSRQIGKSFFLCVLAVEYCIKNPNTTVKYVAPEQKMVRTILRPRIREIIEDCPENLKPHYHTQDNVWRFPNGSEIQLAGTDNGNAESLRGSTASLCIVDEAGFCQELDYLVKSILLPATLTTGGNIILSSTPPISSDHDFIEYVSEAQAKGAFIKKTIEDHARLTKVEIEEMLETYGGRESNVVKREFFCEIIKDESRSVIPEFNEDLKSKIIKEWKRPAFFDYYVSMDIGTKDLTVVLFSYYDFLSDKVIIEDEFVINGPDMTTDKIAHGIREKEMILYKNIESGEQKTPLIRVCDNNLILIADLHRLHGISFLPTSKDNADAALNHMRMLLASEKVIINPRCVTLIEHLENAMWDRQRKYFARWTDKLGRRVHADALDALKYLVRNMVWTKNPYPKDYNLPKGGNIFYNNEVLQPLNEFQRHVKHMFTVKSTIRGKK